MVSALGPESRGLGLSTDPVICVVLLDKTLYSHSATLRPGGKNGYQQTVRET